MRDKLENNQVWVYVIVLLLAAGFGLLAPDAGVKFEGSISIIIAILLYSMFSQIPFASLKESFSNRRFLGALLTVNFVAVPLVVWLLAQFLPDYPPLLLGVYLVLLAPCIDYVIVFTALGKGNEKLMLVSTPFLFLSQMLLLPLYLTLFLGEQAAAIVEMEPFLEAFFGLILLPLFAAIALQLLARKSALGNKILDASAWLPVPFMALTLFVVVVSQIGKLAADFDMILKVIPIYMAFMVIMPLIARMVAQWFKLDAGPGRALIFSGATRNSLVVLPLALALPEGMDTFVAAVIVTQTIVELAGELVYIRLVPRLIQDDNKPEHR